MGQCRTGSADWGSQPELGGQTNGTRNLLNSGSQDSIRRPSGYEPRSRVRLGPPESVTVLNFKPRSIPNPPSFSSIQIGLIDTMIDTSDVTLRLERESACVARFGMAQRKSREDLVDKKTHRALERTARRARDL